MDNNLSVDSRIGKGNPILASPNFNLSIADSIHKLVQIQ
jgi:hypothetical protein